MASTGLTLAGTGANNADAGDAAWTTPGNITASDDAWAESSLSKNETTQYLHATNFGFALPAGSTINGIEVRLEKNRNRNDDLKDHTVQLIKGGTRSGDNNADTVTNWPLTTDGNVDYGGVADLWGLTLTEADVEASTFGVAVRGTGPTGFLDNVVARVDAIWINVHYTAGGGAANPKGPLGLPLHGPLGGPI